MSWAATRSPLWISTIAGGTVSNLRTRTSEREGFDRTEKPTHSEDERRVRNEEQGAAVKISRGARRSDLV